MSTKKSNTVRDKFLKLFWRGGGKACGALPPKNPSLSTLEPHNQFIYKAGVLRAGVIRTMSFAIGERNQTIVCQFFQFNFTHLFFFPVPLHLLQISGQD